MNPKYRMFYLVPGVIGLAMLIWHFVSNLPDYDPVTVMVIAVPDMLFIYLAYKTYPEESRVRTKANSYYNLR